MKTMLLLAMLAMDARARCVMCQRTAAAQNAERARVLNQGIVVLLAPPLIIFAGIVALAWRRGRHP